MIRTVVLTLFALIPVAICTQSQAGFACLFEGVKNNVKTTWKLGSSLSEFTAAWWFRTDTPFVTSYPILTYQNDTNHILSLGAEHKPWIYVFDDDAASIYGNEGSFPKIVGQWYHVAFTWAASDGIVNFYQDGVSIGSGEIYKGTILPSGGFFTFPNFMWGGDHAFGPTDEIGFWTKRLNQSTITSLAAGKLPTAYPTGLSLHWSCDDQNMTAVADDVAGAPAVISNGWSGNDLKVPSSAPLISVNWTAFPVVAIANTLTQLDLPATTVISLPAVGKLVTKSGKAISVGSSNTVGAIYFKAPSSGLKSSVTFSTSFSSQVTLVPNIAPTPVSFNLTATDYSSISFDSLWKCQIGAKPLQTDVINIDPNGDNLLGYLTALPKYGTLKQYGGATITKAPVQISDQWLRLTYVSGDGTSGKTDTFSMILSDGFANSSAITHKIYVSRSKFPPTPLDGEILLNSIGKGALSLGVTADANKEGTFMATLPASGTLRDTSGKLLSAETSNVTLYQWVSEVLAYSSQWDNDSAAAANVIGYPQTFPSYGARVHDWAGDSAEAGTEWIIVRFKHAVYVEQVVVYEVQCSNSVTGIAQRAADGITWEVLFSRKPHTACNTSSLAFAPALNLTAAKHHLTRELMINVSHLDNEWPNIEGIRLVGKMPLTFVSVPTTRKMVYHRTSVTAMTDSFQVIAKTSTTVLSAIPYTYYNAEATVNVTMGTSAASVTMAPWIVLLLSLWSNTR